MTASALSSTARCRGRRWAGPSVSQLAGVSHEPSRQSAATIPAVGVTTRADQAPVLLAVQHDP